MKEESSKTRVFSRHLVGKAASEHLSNFNKILAEMMSSTEGKPEALQGIMVIEVGEANFPGIISSAILGEFGAEVIKVEPPNGDSARKVSQYGVNIEGVGIPFLMESRNKHLITLDLKSKKGRENFIKLVKKADVVIDAMKPGLLDSWGIGYRQINDLNPRLVYVAISPYGHFTSKAKKSCNIPDTDLTAQSEAGYPSLIGNPDAPEPLNFPLKAGVWVASYMSAALAVAGTLTALFHRSRTGEGQMVDIATCDSISTWQSFSYAWGFAFEMPRTRVGNFDWGIYPYGYYETKDGFVTVATSSDADFRGLLKILGRWDLENDWRFMFDRITDDIEKLKDLDSEIRKEIIKFARKDLVRKTLSYSASAAKSKLRGKGFPIVIETRTPKEVLQEEHWKSRKSFSEVDLGTNEKIKIPSSVPKMSLSPPRIKSIEWRIGAHNEKIYKKYGLMK